MSSSLIIAVKTIEPTQFKEYGLTKEKLVNLLKSLIKIRHFENKVEELHLKRGALIGAAHLYQGEEAMATGVISALKPNDVILSSHRGHGHALAKDIPVKNIMAELFGKSTGVCKGLGGSMHVGIYKDKGGLYASAIVGSQIPIAAGAGLAIKYKKLDKSAVCFFGDGATNTGAFHEGLNMAGQLGVPVLFVCENNQMAMSTRIQNTLSAKSVAERVAHGYDITAMVVDGNDVLAVYNATLKARALIKKEGKPVFIECRSFRIMGHSVHRRPKDTEEYRAWKEKDPVKRFQDKLLKSVVITSEELENIDQEIKKEIEASVEFGIKSPTLPFKDLYKLVYAGD
jgi:TPP-dependent pyruvate/acetoin dehydrogenase alpha subunit